MTFHAGSLIRPASGVDFRGKSSLRSVGLTLAVIGLMAAMVAFISSLAMAKTLVIGGPAGSLAAQDAWTFGLSTAALSTLKLGIAVILLGAVQRLWIRIQSVKESLPALVPQSQEHPVIAPRITNTAYGEATIAEKASPPLIIHRMAYALWGPMLLMGVMMVGIGFALGILVAQAVAASDTNAFLVLRTLEPGALFLGEGLLLSGISFLLGTILGSLRQGGGEVQESLGVAVQTLRMPLTAKLFVGLMMIGMMIEVAQFVAYLMVALSGNETTIAVTSVWLGPLREAGLGILLSGIVLALATVARVLGMQFSRIQELIRTGQ